MRREWIPVISIIFIALLAVPVAADAEAPSIAIISPVNNSEVYFGNIDFKYTPTDAVDVYRCTLYINETLARTSSEISNKLNNTFTHTLVTGVYQWSIECQDSAENKRLLPNRTLTVLEDKEAPNITLQGFPATVKSESVVFNYTVTDNASGIAKCELIIDDEAVTTSTSVKENETQQFTYSLEEGEYTWKVKCTDEHNNYRVSTSSFVTIMLPPKIQLISPEDKLETDESTLIFKYIPTSIRGINRCDLLLNDVINETTFVIEKGVENMFEIMKIPTQFITWTVQCRDNEDLLGKASARELTVTTTDVLESAPPKIMLVYPIDTSVVNGSKFSYKASSELLEINICELFIDDLWNVTDAIVEKDVQQDLDFIPLKLGPHTWQIRCIDEREQESKSEKASFMVIDKAPEPVEELKLEKEVIEENVTVEEKPKLTIVDTLGESKLRRIVKILIFILVPLIIVILVLVKELQTPYSGFYSKRI